MNQSLENLYVDTKKNYVKNFRKSKWRMYSLMYGSFFAMSLLIVVMILYTDISAFSVVDGVMDRYIIFTSMALSVNIVLIQFNKFNNRVIRDATIQNSINIVFIIAITTILLDFMVTLNADLINENFNYMIKEMNGVLIINGISLISLINLTILNIATSDQRIANIFDYGEFRMMNQYNMEQVMTILKKYVQFSDYHGVKDIINVLQSEIILYQIIYEYLNNGVVYNDKCIKKRIKIIEKRIKYGENKEVIIEHINNATKGILSNLYDLLIRSANQEWYIVRPILNNINYSLIFTDRLESNYITTLTWEYRDIIENMMENLSNHFVYSYLVDMINSSKIDIINNALILSFSNIDINYNTKINFIKYYNNYLVCNRNDSTILLHDFLDHNKNQIEFLKTIKPYYNFDFKILNIENKALLIMCNIANLKISNEKKII